MSDQTALDFEGEVSGESGHVDGNEEKDEKTYHESWSNQRS